MTLVEKLRWEGLNVNAANWTNLATESLFAGYQPLLLKEYDLFFLDGGFGSENVDVEAAEDWMQALIYENSANVKGRDKGNFYRMQVSEVSVKSYTLATDQKGKVFIKQAAETMKSEIGKRAAKELLDKISDIQNKETEGGDPEKSIVDAESTLNQLKEQEAKMAAGTRGAAVRVGDVERNRIASVKGEEATEQVSNPLEDIKPARSVGILTLVLPQGKTVSEKAISVDNSIAKRSLQEGTSKNQVDIDWYDRILAQEYVKPFCGNFLSPKEGALSYGTEYLICGKGSDSENLEGTVNRLLLLREAVNFLYLQSDTTKQAEALSAATVLAGASANPAVIELVKQGILAAWAYAESICDVKALLSGGKIPLQKTAANWQTQLSNLAGASASQYSGESTGLSYENYLDAFLYGQSNAEIAYRAMDLMEHHMQQDEIYQHCKMDSMILEMEIEVEYEASTMFFDIFGEDTIGSYRFVKQADYQYQ